MKCGVLVAVLAGAVVLATGCAAGPRPVADVAAPSGLGYTKAEAIEVCAPRGQREYLSRLRCPDGKAPHFERAGNFGPRAPAAPRGEATAEGDCDELCESMGEVAPGAVDRHFVDGYDVRCGRREVTLFLDMYHCKVPPPDRAPAGFTIAPATP